MNYQYINPKQVIELQTKGDVYIVDIRDPQSYTLGHIPDAILLDNHNVNEFIASSIFEKPVVVCCYHGNSSQGAAQYLHEQGFKETYSLDGGFELWQQVHPDKIER